MAEIKLTLQEYTTIEQAKVAAENECARLREQLAAAQLADPSGVIPGLVEGLRAARAILPFAMMYIPSDVWPLDALVRFAYVFENQPGITEDDKVLAIDWRDFAKEARDRREKLLAARVAATTD